MQSEKRTQIDELRRELSEMREYENASPPLIKVPPGTKTRDGQDVSGQWIWGALAPHWMISWNLKRRKEIEDMISVTERSADNGERR